VEEIFGGVNVRKRLARDGLYKGVDEDSRKKQDGCEADQLNKEAEKGKGGSALLWSWGINLFRPAHSSPRNANRGTGTFFAKGKPTATTSDRDRCARFGEVEAYAFKERDPATKAKAHGFIRLEQVEVGRELGIFNYECLIFD